MVAAHPVRPPTAGLDRWWLATVTGWEQPWLTRAGVAISYLAGPWGGTILVAIVVLVLLLRRRWWTALFLAMTAALARPARRPVWLAGTALAATIMILTRTYLRAHWLSDTFGSLIVAAGLALLLWWWFAPKLAAERRGPGGRSLDSSSAANHDHA